MNTVHHAIIGWILGIFFVILLGMIAFLSVDISYDSFSTYAQEHRILGAILFGCSMFGATVIAPIAVLPMVPLLEPIHDLVVPRPETLIFKAKKESEFET